MTVAPPSHAIPGIPPWLKQGEKIPGFDGDHPYPLDRANSLVKWILLASGVDPDGIFPGFVPASSPGYVKVSTSEGAFGTALALALAQVTNGAVIDMTDFVGAQTLDQDVTITTQHIIVECAPSLVLSGSHKIVIAPGAHYSGFHWNRAPWTFTGSGDAFAIGASSAPTRKVVNDGLNLNIATANASARGLVVNNCQEFEWIGIEVVGNGVNGTSQKPVVFDGTGLYTGSASIFGFKAFGGLITVTCTGAGVNAVNSLFLLGGWVNNNSFGTGIQVEQSGNGCFFALDVSGFTTGLHLKDGPSWNRYQLRFEANTADLDVETSDCISNRITPQMGQGGGVKYTRENGYLTTIDDPDHFAIKRDEVRWHQARDAAFNMIFESGLTGPWATALLFRTYLGVEKFRLSHDGADLLRIYRLNSAIRFLMDATKTELSAEGAGKVRFNVTGGTGGVEFCDGAGNVIASIDNAGVLTLATKTVSLGVADSGGAGFKLLRVPN